MEKLQKERKGTKGDLKMSENIKGQNQSGEKRGGSNRTIIVIGAIIIVLLVAVIVILLLRKPAGDTASPVEDTPQREVLVNDDNISEVAEQLENAAEEYVPLGRYTAMMNFEWHFATGDAESSDSYVANSAQNTHDVYFDVFLADDMENAIYESPVIPRGSEIRNIKLKTNLDAGTYDCVLVYHLVDEEQNTVSTASFTLKVIIEG